MKFRKIYLLMLLAGFMSCTDLKETLNEDLTRAQAEEYLNSNTDVGALLQGCYDGLRLPYQDQSRMWAAQQHTSDETLGPTRGPDWDDNGIWRVLHNHTWTADHAFLSSTFNELLQVVFSTTNALSFNTTPQQAAEARYLRAFVMFSIADGWNQVPFRQPGENLLNPPQVLKGSAAVDFIISELNAIMANLPDGPVNKANKNAAKVLLMKCYLNKGTFADRTAPRFDAADMQQVITLADQIIAGNQYSLDDNYFDNFAPNNDQVSSENIWTAENKGGSSSGNVRSRWFCTLHYNQNPSGWNGFATLSDFYNSFEDSDVRKKATYTGMTDVSGINAGFLIGQQYDQNGTALKDRKGNPLAFTPEVAAIETGNNLEVTGIRVIKYPIDYLGGDNADNDYVYFRYADVLLMKAEALLRTNDAAGALAIVNDLRTKRGATTLGALTADDLLKERGRELYWEGWRRQDLIRFGKFLDAWQEKPASGNERLLFPIPAAALAVNPNLEQNPGY
ncbi:MAG TPA: RagB/SusD family nutrient uptake outer membrane protein [Saprospiraceae bacterium]|nr:RagB/SusD family nutrient uptake outer membrane protein [Saprospiraceae bacterium]